jgi:hypothetical protein
VLAKAADPMRSITAVSDAVCRNTSHSLAAKFTMEQTIIAVMFDARGSTWYSPVRSRAMATLPNSETKPFSA